MPQIEAVIFDLGNVLIGWHPEAYYDSTIGPDRRREMFAEVDLHSMNDRVDLGENFTETIYKAADENPKWRAEIREWHDNWIKLLTPVITHSVTLLRALRAKGVPVFSLTNFGAETHAYAVTQYPFLGEFDRQYISGHLKMIKPDPRIFARVEEDCGLLPGHLLFTDDRADNIAEARKRGWNTHLFEGPQGWADRLVAEGLLDAQEAAA